MSWAELRRGGTFWGVSGVWCVCVVLCTVTDRPTDRHTESSNPLPFACLPPRHTSWPWAAYQKKLLSRTEHWANVLPLTAQTWQQGVRSSSPPVCLPAFRSATAILFIANAGEYVCRSSALVHSKANLYVLRMEHRRRCLSPCFFLSRYCCFSAKLRHCQKLEKWNLSSRFV